MKEVYRIIWVFFVFLVAVCLAATFASEFAKASGSGVLVNEIYPNPATGEIEAVELSNSSETAVSLDNFSIMDGTNKPKLLSGVIGAGSYKVLSKGIDFTFTLNDDSDILVLKDGLSTIDCVTWGKFDDGDISENALTPAKGKSLSRIPNGVSSGSNKDDFRAIAPSLGIENVLPKYSDKIIISEIFPHPAGGADGEFIEIFNQDAEEVNLRGWQLDDEPGGSSAYTISDDLTVGPNQFLVFYKPTTGIALNDDGDSARLIDPNGDVKSEVNYGSSKINESYSLFTGKFDWTDNVSPGLANIATSIKAESPAIGGILPISEARKHGTGETVTIEGIVTAPPGSISDSYFYIEDELAGIQVYSYNKSFPILDAGMRVRVTGVISEYYQESRVKIENISGIVVLAAVGQKPPRSRRGGEIGEEDEGTYIEISGAVTETSGSTFFVSDGGIIKVYIRNSDTVNKPKMRKGDKVTVSGIISQYKNGYRVLPFLPGSVKILTSGSLPESGYDKDTKNLIFTKLWKSQQSQPMRRKRLATNLGGL